LEDLKHLISNFCFCDDGFQIFSTGFCYAFNVNFLFASIKLPANSEIVYWNLAKYLSLDPEPLSMGAMQGNR
jgi:hypothetical protein